MPRFAPVMATGIVARSLSLHASTHPAGLVLAWVAGALYAVTLARSARAPAEPSARLSFVAGTVVVASLIAVRALALGLELVGIAACARALAAGDLAPPRAARATGGVLLPTVALQAAAQAAADLGARILPALFLLAGLAFVAGVALYLAAIPAVVRGLRSSPGLRGQGDDWIASGALAISALAAAALATAARPAGVAGVEPVARTLALAAWCAAGAWAVALGLRETRQRIVYGPDRWSTVFPLGMLSVSALLAGRAGASGVLQAVSLPLAAIAGLAWLAVTAGWLRGLRRA